MKLIDKIQNNTRRIWLFSFDLISLIIIDALYYLGIFIWGNEIKKELVALFATGCFMLLTLMLMSRFVFGIYSCVWRYTSTSAYIRLIFADMCGCAFTVIFSLLIGLGIDVDVYVCLAALGALGSIGARFSYRLLYKRINYFDHEKSSRVKVAIIGAGSVGAMLSGELKINKASEYEPALFFDTDIVKIGGTIDGIRVYDEADANELLEKFGITNVIIAMKNVESDELSHIRDLYHSLGCKVKIYAPSVLSGEDDTDSKRVVRDFEIEDLLFRSPISINGKKEFEFYAGKTVLVTGGGGSIGSELCRQIAKCDPKKLIIVDIYENNAYEIQQELIRKYGEGLDLAVEIASVRDKKRLERIFEHYRPELVFHAAAHKHVPLMEHSFGEAIKNNVLGTYNTVEVAEKYGVEKFVLISTDKAVNPTNIMGASKRVCEMIIRSRSDSKTTYSAVRFGNVLGSNGSVIPLFKRQIAQGGPITITDSRIIRYFMTIPEASQLVMQTGAMAKRSELFVLDMGKPVKIYDLALNMIKLSGLEVGKDIEIKEIGLRPGEKLYEELLIRTEELTKTENNLIFIERDSPVSREEVDEKIEMLISAADEAERHGDVGIFKKALSVAVPTFHDPEEVNKNACETREMQEAEKPELIH